jgi:hypothetical protein
MKASTIPCTINLDSLDTCTFGCCHLETPELLLDPKLFPREDGLGLIPPSLNNPLEDGPGLALPPNSSETPLYGAIFGFGVAATCDVVGGRVAATCDVAGGRVVATCDVVGGRVAATCDVVGGRVAATCADTIGAPIPVCCADEVPTKGMPPNEGMTLPAF